MSSDGNMPPVPSAAVVEHLRSEFDLPEDCNTLGKIVRGVRSKLASVQPSLEKQTDASVDHPAHYGGADNLYEVIKVIEAWGLGFHLGNVVKYIARSPHKGSTIEDLKKSRWYLDRFIAEKEGNHVGG